MTAALDAASAPAGASGPSIPLTPVSAWQPGDPLFAAGSDGTPDNPGHVGIYLGGNQVLHAPTPATSSASFRSTGTRRLPAPPDLLR
ncbi:MULTISPECIES: NlpC/P60 family protein [unclassified Frankia]